MPAPPGAGPNESLLGVGVLVTRPLQQAASLCGLLEAAGARVIRLPAIEIGPAPGTHELQARLRREPAFDMLIFTSANAVRYGVRLLAEQPAALIAAIGPATARALEIAGRHAMVTPAGPFDSESLLRHPQLASVAGRRILIVKGLHGRELLQAELARRGARVEIADVYGRNRAVHDAADLTALEARIEAGEIQIITATSAEIAASLLETTPSLRRAFERLHWLVPAERIAAALRERRMKAPILLADSADDHDLVAAVMRWRSSVSGA